MTLNEWREDISLANDLRKVMELPVVQKAISVIDGMSAAKTLGNTNALTALAGNAHVLFGFDSGRASVISDLNNLTIVPEQVDDLQPSYTGEF